VIGIYFRIFQFTVSLRNTELKRAEQVRMTALLMLLTAGS